MTTSIFEEKKPKKSTKKISFTCPVELVENLETVKNKLSEIAPEMIFNTDAIFVDALDKALKKAERELKEMPPKKPLGITPRTSTK